MQFGTQRYQKDKSLFLFVAFSLLVVCAISSGSAFAGPPHARTEVGIRCQQEYQNNWQVDVGNSDVWRRCSNFNSQMRQTDNVEFYFNLHGANSHWRRIMMDAAKAVAGQIQSTSYT